MKISSPQGPTIPSSTAFLTNFTKLLKITDEISGDSFISPNPSLPSLPTTLSGGTLSNLNDPIENNQGATYAYVLAHSGVGGNPGGDLKSIQYNNNGVFGGTSTLKFDKTVNPNILYANNISNGTILIGNGTISGLTNPLSNQQAATKSYVDSKVSKTINTDNTAGVSTYSAADLVSGYIYRDNQTSGTVIDHLPTALDIITAAGASTGSIIEFNLKNISSDYNSIVVFDAGIGITMTQSLNIFSGYQYNGIMVVTSANTLTLYTINCSRTNTTNWSIEFVNRATQINTIAITDYQLIDKGEIANISLDGGVYKITSALLNSSIISVTPTGPTFAQLVSPADMMVELIEGPDGFLIFNLGIWKTGGVDIYIINDSVVVGADITLTGLSGPIPWTLDPNSNMTVPPGYTGHFMLYLTIGNFPEVSSITAANVYTLGIYPTS